MSYWLIKSEPHTFSLSDLKACSHNISSWDGVRNYQARNFMRDHMQVGDDVLFYHSSCSVPGVVGLAEVVTEAYPDPSAFDPNSPHYDPKSTEHSPRWFCVDVAFRDAFKNIVSLKTMRRDPVLNNGELLLLLRPRLSVMPISPIHWNRILELADHNAS